MSLLFRGLLGRTRRRRSRRGSPPGNRSRYRALGCERLESRYALDGAGPEIAVYEGGLELLDWDYVYFGELTYGQPVQKTFTVKNVGDEDLSLSPVSGAMEGFRVASNVGDTLLSPAETTTFTVEATADAVGYFFWDLGLANTDEDENPFNLSLEVDVLNTAPTTSGISDVTVNEDAPNTDIDLWSAFDDLEDSDAELWYEVVDVTDLELFDYWIDSETGTLTLDYLEDAFGQADVTVEAIDTEGLWVETTFTVTVNAVNDAPVIHDFIGGEGPAGWTFTGWVSDVDDDPTGWVVDLGGVLEGHTATVDETGWFSITVEVSQDGWATADVSDGEDDAEQALYYVDVV